MFFDVKMSFFPNAFIEMLMAAFIRLVPTSPSCDTRPRNPLDWHDPVSYCSEHSAIFCNDLVSLSFLASDNIFTHLLVLIFGCKCYWMAATTHRYGHSCRTGLVRNLLFLSHAISPELLQFFPAVNWFFFKADKKAKQSEEKNLKSSCRWTFFALMKKSRKSDNHGRKLRKEKKITSLEIMVPAEFIVELLMRRGTGLKPCFL